ncbi:MAG: protein-glutamate O-methyltransferase CheR [Treponema sp.]|nr:protein-glutamate O-methyltransferase CheR [Treponema sp.]
MTGISDGDFERYRRLIYDESGIHFTALNRAILESRLKERLREREGETALSYFEKLRSDKGELRDFLDSITTNLTRFFRNQAHFDALEKFVIPALIDVKKNEGNYHIKIWSAGCATGEEPYTIAMLLAGLLSPPWNFSIIASDLSLQCLMKAKEGFYADAHMSGVPETTLRKYFDRAEGGWKIHRDIMAKVRFDYHNLKNDPGFNNIDIVFCRNVLIYFDEAAQRAVIERFWNAMAKKSFLFIGHSESLFGMRTNFTFVKTPFATLYKKWV